MKWASDSLWFCLSAYALRTDTSCYFDYSQWPRAWEKGSGSESLHLLSDRNVLGAASHSQSPPLPCLIFGILFLTISHSLSLSLSPSLCFSLFLFPACLPICSVSWQWAGVSYIHLSLAGHSYRSLQLLERYTGDKYKTWKERGGKRREGERERERKTWVSESVPSRIILFFIIILE